MPQSSLQEAINAIAGLARSGRLNEAALLAAQSSAAAGSDPVFLALAGTVELHRGQFARASEYLAQVNRQRPDDIVVRGNLVDALFRAGNEDEAMALCSPESARADKTLRLARIGGHLAQSREQFARAAEFYRIAVNADPKDWSSWNNLGNALSGDGQADEAIAALKQACTLAPNSQPIQINLGNALIDAGRGEEAEAILVDAAHSDPSDPTPCCALFTLYGLAGREDAAFDALSEAARRAPDDGAILADLAQEALRRNHYDTAESSFETLLANTPADAQALVGLATIYERMNREAELEPLRARALAAGADEAAIQFIDALRYKRSGEYQQAFDALESAGHLVAEARTQHLRGVLLDHLKRYDEAFAAFEAMNEHWKADPVRPVERATEYREAIVRATQALTPQWLASWSPVAGSTEFEYPAPIFLLGFPRSGTTLLDTMLMADPSVRVLEEEAIIGDIEREIGGIDALANLSQSELQAQRQSYFERAGKIVDLAPGVRIVDKHPLHGNKAELIHRLFPEAQFLLALRHPCDVLLSCFLTNFRNNPAMANFLDLESAAVTYDLTFTHWEKARSLCNLNVRTVVYERLVEDTERELRPVFAWLGLEWPSEQFDHTQAARARGTVNTASYAQVTEPVYKRASGRWQRYARQLEPILPVLAPWAEKFGYSLIDGRIPVWPEPDPA